MEKYITIIVSLIFFLILNCSVFIDTCKGQGIQKKNFSGIGVTYLIDSNQVYSYKKGKLKNSFSALSKAGDWMDQADAWLMFILLYAINPIITVEIDGKLKWGWTKEVSLGFGDLGQFRTSIEYSWIDFENYQNIIRTGIKYDILLKNKINRNKDPVESSTLTIGGGYITDFSRYGYFPEVSFGYSFRDSKTLIYPCLKLRYSFMCEGKDFMDFSFGLLYGFANPFKDYQKPRKNK